MRVQPDQLATLAAAVDGGSFEAAAASLHVTPSAVSQRMRALESAAGAVLVVRSRPVRLTRAGEPYLRLARQLAALIDEAERASDAASDARTAVPLAINADSLATWALPALAAVADRVQLDVLREDEAHTPRLLREGSVMAAVTSDPVPIQGCTIEPLGTMRYRPMASAAFVERWFRSGFEPASFTVVPVIDFDRLDTLQSRVLESMGVDPAAPPRHRIPGSLAYAAAIQHGIGWGLIADLERDRAHDLVVLGDAVLDVPLWWQQWALEAPALRLVADSIRGAAAAALATPQR